MAKLVSLGELALEVARENTSASKRKAPNIVEFVEAKWGLGARPFPVQRMILKAFYGIPLDTKTKFEVTDFRRENSRWMTEADYLKYAFDEGRSNVREVKEGDGRYRRKLILPVGRRSGKTELSAWISCFEIDKLLQKAWPQNYYGVAPADEIKLCCVATAKDQASILYGKVRGYLMACQRFTPYRANNTQSYYKFQSQNDIERYGRYGAQEDALASIGITFYSTVAKGLRGHGNILVILDEVAHFTAQGGSSAEDVYEAVTPSMAAYAPKDPETRKPRLFEDGEKMSSDAREILISSPMGKEGLFYEHFRNAWDSPEYTFAFQGPTWEVNPEVPGKFLEQKYRDNPKSFFVEFGAEFTDSTSGWIEDREDLVQVVDPKARRIWRAPSRRPHLVGIDIGLTKGGDSSAIAIGHIENGEIVLDFLEDITAGEGKYKDRERLDIEEDVVPWIHDLSKRFHFAEGIFDQWCGIPFEQALHRKGLKQLTMKKMTRDETSFMFKTFKDMMWARKLRLYNWEPNEDNPQQGTILNSKDELCGYLEELMTLQETRVSENIIKVEAPRRDNLHDDRSDALVRMVWLAAQKLGSKKFTTTSSARAGLRQGYRPSSRRSAFRGGSDPLRQKPRRKRW